MEQAFIRAGLDRDIYIKLLLAFREKTGQFVSFEQEFVRVEASKGAILVNTVVGYGLEQCKTTRPIHTCSAS